MNASIPALLLVLVLSGTWLLGRRRPKPFLRSTDTSDVVALNRAQIERLREQRPEVPAPVVRASSSTVGADSPAAAQPLAALPGRRQERLRQLQAWLLGSRDQRLEAIAAAHRWQHRSVLPLLRRALRDPDPEVMAAAAAAIERFRGRTAAGDALATGLQQPWRGRPQAGRTAAVLPLPRSVLRTR